MGMKKFGPPRGGTHKVLLTVGLVGLTVAALGAAVATFTSTTNVAQSTSSGTVEFAPISTNGAGQRLSVAATDVAPGDTIQRAVTLTNTGTIDMLPGTVNLTTTASTSSLLDTGGRRPDHHGRPVLGGLDRDRRSPTPTPAAGPPRPCWPAAR